MTEATVLNLVHLIFLLYYLILVARALLPWFRVDPYHPVMRFLIYVTEPLLAPLRRRIRPMGGLDFTPMIAVILLIVAEQLVALLIRILF